MKKIKLKISMLVVFLSSVFANTAFSQIDYYFTPAYGFGFSKARLDKLQASYTTYQAYMNQNLPNDPITADPNWDSKGLVRCLSFHAGISGAGVMAGLSYFPYRLQQERYVMQASGYGRKWEWKEARNECLLDLGFGSKYIDIFGSFGVNFNTYKMLSYQVYPSGAESINTTYNFNGLFTQSDVGLSFGGGLKVKVIPFVALEIRYLFAGDLLPGEKNSLTTDNAALTDNSFARVPGTNHYPQSYTEPLELSNAIIPNFRRSTLQFSILFYYRQND